MKSARAEQLVTYKGTPVRLTVELSAAVEARRQWDTPSEHQVKTKNYTSSKAIVAFKRRQIHSQIKTVNVLVANLPY